ncbi:MAG: Fic family protein [Acidimicrobiales bacterium]
MVTTEWRGRRLEAFVPPGLLPVPDLSTAAVRASALAEGALGAVDARLRAGLQVPARLLLHAEGVASSRIEEVRAPPAEVAVASADPAVGGAAGWVADNLRAVDAALAHQGPLRADDLWDWHRLLMVHADLEPALVGIWRDRIGWVGGATPHLAAFVPPPPELVGALMEDLVAFAQDDRVDPVAHAALVHAQFETIHPFADGNGRIGRILIGWVLQRRLGLAVPPPVSGTFLRDRGGYLTGLTRYRLEGPDGWTIWFARAMEQTAYATEAILGDVADVIAAWPQRLTGLRADAAARRLVPHLSAHPALDVATAASLAGVSEQAARGALDELVARGILRDASTSSGRTGRPRRWWVAGELLDRLSAGG